VSIFLAWLTAIFGGVGNKYPCPSFCFLLGSNNDKSLVGTKAVKFFFFHLASLNPLSSVYPTKSGSLNHVLPKMLCVMSAKFFGFLYISPFSFFSLFI
jgi:hypothetical protein